MNTNKVITGLVITLDGTATETRATITNNGIFITRFETPNTDGFLKRLDRQMKDYGFLRGGYESCEGVLVATASRMVTA